MSHDESDDVAPTGRLRPPGLAGRVRRLRPEVLVLALAAAVGVVVRAWLVRGRVPVWWADSIAFEDVAHAGLGSLDFWAGARAPGVPLPLVAVDGDHHALMVAQCVIAAVAWAVLAYQVARSTAGAVRWVGAGLVVALSLAAPVTTWDRAALSESLALSSLALLAAGAVALLRRPGPAQVALCGTAVVAWCLTRDTHAVVALAIPALAAGAWVWRRRRPAAGHLVVAALALVVGSSALVAAHHGERALVPTRNVYVVRILPYPDRVAWFSAHGMPQADELVDRAGTLERSGEVAPVNGFGDDDPAFARWEAWFERDGVALYRRWLVEHPTVLATEPLERPERVFNNARGDRSFYAAGDEREVAFLAELLMPSRPLGIVVGVGATAWALWSRRFLRSPCAMAGAGLLVLALPHALVAWHADGMESARHLVVPVVQMHLAAVLAVVGALDRQSRSITDGSASLASKSSGSSSSWRVKSPLAGDPPPSASAARTTADAV